MDLISCLSTGFILVLFTVAFLALALSRSDHGKQLQKMSVDEFLANFRPKRVEEAFWNERTIQINGRSHSLALELSGRELSLIPQPGSRVLTGEAKIDVRVRAIGERLALAALGDRSRGVLRDHRISLRQGRLELHAREGTTTEEVLTALNTLADDLEHVLEQGPEAALRERMASPKTPQRVRLAALYAVLQHDRVLGEELASLVPASEGGTGPLIALLRDRDPGVLKAILREYSHIEQALPYLVLAVAERTQGDPRRGLVLSGVFDYACALLERGDGTQEVVEVLAEATRGLEAAPEHEAAPGFARFVELAATGFYRMNAPALKGLREVVAQAVQQLAALPGEHRERAFVRVLEEFEEPKAGLNAIVDVSLGGLVSDSVVRGVVEQLGVWGSVRAVPALRRIEGMDALASEAARAIAKLRERHGAVSGGLAVAEGGAGGLAVVAERLPREELTEGTEQVHSRPVGQTD